MQPPFVHDLLCNNEETFLRESKSSETLEMFLQYYFHSDLFSLFKYLTTQYCVTRLHGFRRLHTAEYYGNIFTSCDHSLPITNSQRQIVRHLNILKTTHKVFCRICKSSNTLLCVIRRAKNAS